MIATEAAPQILRRLPSKPSLGKFFADLVSWLKDQKMEPGSIIITISARTWEQRNFLRKAVLDEVVPRDQQTEVQAHGVGEIELQGYRLRIE